MKWRNGTVHIQTIRLPHRFVYFASASLVSCVVDYLLFFLCSIYWKNTVIPTIFAATFIARIGSGSFNFFLNRRFSFKSKMSPGKEMVRYGILFIGQMCLSASLVSWFSVFPFPINFIKMVVDTLLFFINYSVQKEWVFKQELSYGS